jgi:hypothetical protein
MSSPISDDDVEQIRSAIFAGNKIEAIKRYRGCTGAGLAEAKGFVEALEEELRRVAPDQFTAPPASARGCAVYAVGIPVLVGVLMEVWA